MHGSRLRLALVAAALLAGAAHAQDVKAPPLPPGSHLVRLDPGMNEEERKRSVRAHHHKFHHGYHSDHSVFCNRCHFVSPATVAPWLGRTRTAPIAVQSQFGRQPNVFNCSHFRFFFLHVHVV